MVYYDNSVRGVIYLGTLISLWTSSVWPGTEKRSVWSARKKSCELTLVKYSIRLVIVKLWASDKRFKAGAIEYFPPSRPICVSAKYRWIYSLLFTFSHRQVHINLHLSVQIEGHLVLCKHLKQKPFLGLVYL